ncbi:TPA: hypothetical protein RXN42_001236 [Campylobacter jejuni]|uniref:hypothetical protein n=1 Tax=Campylobacter jejuni TaxID=197 RepID=UPI0016424F50|nr:hypothetical protein [Campylobacter jejuni]MBX2051026.1 hypothetical protein [Campylobacter jejuni]HDX3661812.1 hypothetical protein [Campylobacter jejuni]HEA7975597.1 hypothetical protein [Campylobacter jejuni]HEA7993785.1 hypothetical protein [Campylobacter jejuni]HEA8183396.1 hypothetical protein [Campylobacter jejuni]
MGIFNTLKTLTLSAKCATGWHGGEFKNEDDKPKCFFFQKYVQIATNIHKK